MFTEVNCKQEPENEQLTWCYFKLTGAKLACRVYFKCPCAVQTSEERQKKVHSVFCCVSTSTRTWSTLCTEYTYWSSVWISIGQCCLKSSTAVLHLPEITTATFGRDSSTSKYPPAILLIWLKNECFTFFYFLYCLTLRVPRLARYSNDVAMALTTCPPSRLHLSSQNSARMTYFFWANPEVSITRVLWSMDFTIDFWIIVENKLCDD